MCYISIRELSGFQNFHDDKLQIPGYITLSSTLQTESFTTQKMKFSIKDIFGKCDQINSFLRIWSRLLTKSLMENFIFCAVFGIVKRLMLIKLDEFVLQVSTQINKFNYLLKLFKI